MGYPVFYVPAGDVLPVFFASYDGGTGASITLTGLAVTDIEIYKDGSTTQRASDAGYTLLDTDGIDFDTLTGIHGFSIDTGDNTDASFYTVGAWFTVVVSAVTIDGQTVSFIACQFRLMAAESVAAKPKVDVDAWLGTAAATPTVAGVPEVDITHIGGTGVTAASGIPEVKVASIANDAITAAAIQANAIGAAEIADGAIDAATFAADVDAEILSYIVDDGARIDASDLNTEIDALKDGGRLDLLIDAIKAVTDLLTAAHTEPSGVPAADETPLDKLGYIYMALRNKVTVTSTKKTFFDDGDAAEWEQDLSDDGTTYTQSEANAI